MLPLFVGANRPRDFRKINSNPVGEYCKLPPPNYSKPIGRAQRPAPTSSQVGKNIISHYSFICGATTRRTLQPCRWLHLIPRDGVGTVPYNTAVGLYKLCVRFVNRPYALHIIIWFSFSILIIHYSFFIGKKGTVPFLPNSIGIAPAAKLQ